MAEPPALRLEDQPQYRIIASRYPPISIFETLVDPDELEIAYALESLTNDRLQAQAGDLYLLERDEWITGPGASVVMAPFTHIGNPSRFSDGSYGVYYAARDEPTAIAETVFHAERRLRDTDEAPIELEMRCYRGTANAVVDDLRGLDYASLREPEISTWPTCQRFAAERREAGSSGLLYGSARRLSGNCLAAFKPSAVSRPEPTKHYRYCWNGREIDQVLSVSNVPLDAA